MSGRQARQSSGATAPQPRASPVHARRRSGPVTYTLRVAELFGLVATFGGLAFISTLRDWSLGPRGALPAVGLVSGAEYLVVTVTQGAGARTAGPARRQTVHRLGLGLVASACLTLSAAFFTRWSDSIIETVLLTGIITGMLGLVVVSNAWVLRTEFDVGLGLKDWLDTGARGLVTVIAALCLVGSIAGAAAQQPPLPPADRAEVPAPSPTPTPEPETPTQPQVTPPIVEPSFTG